jgi:tetratricopeptide (TPR) repeat protein
MWRAAIVAGLMGAVGFAQPPRPPTVITQLAAQAAAARDANNVPEAIRLYQKAVALSPKWAEGWWFLGSLHYENDQYAPCRDSLRRFVALDQTVAAGYSLLGLCEFQTKEFGPSLAHLEKALSIGLPEGEDLMQVTLYHAAMLHTKARNFERAMQLCAYINRFQADDPKIVALMGVAQLRRPLFLQEVPQEDREMVMKLGRAFALQAERKMQESIRAYEEVVAQYPNVSSIHYAFGAVLLSSEPERGVEALKSELKVTPNHVPALVSLAAYYLKLGEPRSGLPYAERAAKAGPEEFPARATYGRILVEMDERQKGILELEAARKLAPDSPEVRFSLASAYGKAGRPAEAAKERQEFTRLKKLDKAGGGKQ